MAWKTRSDDRPVLPSDEPSGLIFGPRQRKSELALRIAETRGGIGKSMPIALQV